VFLFYPKLGFFFGAPHWQFFASPAAVFAGSDEDEIVNFFSFFSALHPFPSSDEVFDFSHYN